MIGKKTDACRETLRAALFDGAMDIHCALNNDPSLPHAANTLGDAEAPLIGGNLSILYALRGSSLDIDPRGKILYLEDLDELYYHMDRMIQNLKYSGWFNGLVGLVIGHMTDMHDKNPEDPFGLTTEAMIREAIGDAPYPVCFNFPAGHGADNRALIMGQNTKLSVTNEGATLSFVKKISV